MPFLNDRMEEGQRRVAERQALALENIGPGDLEDNHRRAATVGRFRFSIPAIEAHLRSQIIGQEGAITAVLDLLRIVLADIGDGRRPLATVLFLGPTGVGKTELVRSLAQALHGDADALCRIDMNTLGQEHYAAAISGAPPGYVGSKEGRTLFNPETIEGSLERPGIVLFDEIEKASPQVAMALLNIFDHGTLTVASGERTYSFRNSLIFMTSNLAAHQLRQAVLAMHSGWRRRLFPLSLQAQQERLQELAHTALIERFAPEFVGRLDHIEVFHAIQGTDVAALIAREIEKLNGRLAKHRCRLTLSPALIEHLARTGFDRQFGARSLRRVLRRLIEAPLAQLLMEAQAGHRESINLRDRQGSIDLGADLFRGEVVFSAPG